MSEATSTRLKCLEMAKPDVSVPDTGFWIERAKTLEAYVTGAGQAEKPQPEPVMNGNLKPGQSASRGPGNQVRR